MKKVSLFALTLILFLSSGFLSAQDTSYVFKDIKTLPATPVKNQYRSGTCWSFSGISFFESEVLRMGKGTYDLSEMFNIWHSYDRKAVKYVRMHGSLNFGGGGAFQDDLDVLRNDGVIPEEIFSGLNIGEEKHVHGEMDAVLKAYVDAVIKNKNRKLTPVWHQGFEGILDAYLGTPPKQFEYKGETYTPKSFAEKLGLNPDNYVIISSFNHHPFYQQFVLEVPDNWSWGEVYNVPLDDLSKILNYSIDQGYTIGWATDMSDPGFSSKTGVAIVPEKDFSEMSKGERDTVFIHPVKQKVITQDLRQKAFDNFTTTDDHGMHIIGKATAQDGTEYFKVKNSWGTKGIYKGYLYASKAFVLYKTTNIMVNKDAIPKDIRKKLGIK